MDDDGPMSQVALLVNPAARQGRAASQVDRVLARLRQHGVEPLVLDSSSAEVAQAAAHHAVAAGVERMVAFGGDGIVHLATGAVAGTSTVLGIVAGGTGNDAAEALGLAGGSLEDRVDLSLKAPTAVDVITKVDDDGSLSRPSHAVTSCVAGFPAAVNVRAEAMRVPRGPSRYTVATLLGIPTMRPGLFRLVLDGEEREERAAVLVVANTGLFGGGMRICPDAVPDDGLLDVCLVGDVGRLDLLRSFGKVRTGAHLDHPDVSVHQAAEVRIEAVDADPLVRADGEPFGSMPCTLAARPGALWVAGATTRPPGRV